MIGKIINHEGNKLAIEFEDEINSNFLELLANNDDNLAKVEFLDNRQMSQKQNALSHVLIADVSRWSYDEPKWIESVLKYYYEAKSGVYFEHSRATKNEATEWIGFLIEFILKNDMLTFAILKLLVWGVIVKRLIMRHSHFMQDVVSTIKRSTK